MHPGERGGGGRACEGHGPHLVHLCVCAQHKKAQQHSSHHCDFPHAVHYASNEQVPSHTFRIKLALVLGDATILSLNCDISKARYCNRTLVAETIVSRRRLYRINSDNRSTNRLRVEFN